MPPSRPSSGDQIRRRKRWGFVRVQGGQEGNIHTHMFTNRPKHTCTHNGQPPAPVPRLHTGELVGSGACELQHKDTWHPNSPCCLDLHTWSRHLKPGGPLLSFCYETELVKRPSAQAGVPQTSRLSPSQPQVWLWLQMCSCSPPAPSPGSSSRSTSC